MLRSNVKRSGRSHKPQRACSTGEGGCLRRNQAHVARSNVKPPAAETKTSVPFAGSAKQRERNGPIGGNAALS